VTEQIKIAAAIEIFFIVSSFFLLSKPGTKVAYHWAGTVMLCLTFCWSVILGCIFALNAITVQI
jgi:hypothetical protein